MIYDKTAIIKSAKSAILNGESTLSTIAQAHGIARRTLQYWLAELGDEYKMLRQAWIDNILVDAGEELEAVRTAVPVREIATENLRLARARELWKRACWYAERRDPERYGPKQAEIAAQIVVNVTREKTTSCDVSAI